MNPTTEQLDCIDKFNTQKTLRINAYAGTGKALRDDQPVLTPTGYKPIASLAVGEMVIGRDGHPYPVTGVYPQGERELFEMQLSDDTRIVCDADHIWCVQRSDHRRTGAFTTRTTAELAKKPRMSNGKATYGDGTRAYWWMPMCEPVEFESCGELKIDPWLLGALLGNASTSGSVVFSTADMDTLTNVQDSIAGYGISAKHNSGYDYRLTGRTAVAGEFGSHNELITQLRILGLMGSKSGTKFIPRKYLMASPSERLRMLQGLFDTDGYACGPGVEYTTISKQLSADVKFIVESLGGTIVTSEKIPTIDGVEHSLAYRSYVKLPDGMAPFRCDRKAEGMNENRQRPPYRTIEAIVPAGIGSATCISVDSPDRLFLTTNCVPTHNTSTLTMIAKQTQRKGTYLAFNKSIAEDAGKKFPNTIACSTQHSLAFRSFRGVYEFDKLTGSINGGFIASKFKLKTYDVNPQLEIRPRGVGFLIHQTIRRWCSSGRDEMCLYDVPMDGRLDLEPDDSKERLRKFILPLAEQVWERMIDRAHPLPLGHDGYLKLWAMNRAKIPGDFILLDEAQDTSGVMMELMRHQDAQLIAVGDAFQAIYEWRGARNAMTELPVDLEARLSQSFRFGETIAGYATKILGLLGETLPLRGNPAKADALAICEKPSAVLARTNGVLIEKIVDAIEAGSRPCVVGGVGEMLDMIGAAEKLMANQPVDRPLDFFGFKNWGEVKEHSERPEGKDIRRIVKTIDHWGTDRLRAALEGLPKQESQADVIMSTAHKAKGREFKHVRLCSDFLLNIKTEEEKAKDRENCRMSGREYVEPEPPDAELRLFYVACTRAETTLEIPAVLNQKMAGLGADVDATAQAKPEKSTPIFLASEDPKPEKKRKQKFTYGDLELIGELAQEALARNDHRAIAIYSVISKLPIRTLEVA